MDDQQDREAEELAAMRTFLTRIAPRANLKECRAMMFARLEPGLVEAIAQVEAAAQARAAAQAKAAVLAAVQAIAAPAERKRGNDSVVRSLPAVS
ncbi:hypothetical protein [Paraburkholderia sp. J7]|uniref:hypothetical protein n=1 Tax=Paraburkholderia sp. J7 TaxID=2805438 RepID=UPI002AB5FDC2|nr:hypothetical protein [Paraburkholderia sp. J7]